MNGVERYARGTCDGTGAAINVCLGFVPKKVIVKNFEDAGGLYPYLEWDAMDALVAAIAEGIKTMGLSDLDFDRVPLADAAGGIDPYDGGDELTYDGVTNNRWEDSTGADASEAFVDGNYERAATTDAAYKCIGTSIFGAATPPNGAKVKTPAGFTIGLDADINVNGEQLTWEAWG